MRSYFTRAGRLARLFLLASSLFAAVQSIDCGGPTDSGFSAGTWPAPGGTIAYTIPVNPPGTVTDVTLRYCVSCSYTIPTTEGQPYLVTLTFVEPTVQAAGQRVFSVWINDQPALRDFDVYAAALAETGQGYLAQIQRSFVMVPNNAQLVITFSASVRNAVISSIQVSPLFVLSASVVMTQRSVCVDDLATPTAKRLGANSISPVGAPSDAVNIFEATTRVLLLDMNLALPQSCAGLELYTLLFSDGGQRVMVAIPDDGNISKSSKWVAVPITPPGTT